MQFDPTFDYGDTDLTNTENLIRWKFGELIKCLVTISSSAKRQVEIIGMGAVCDEMACDLDTYFSLEHPAYLEHGLFSSNQIEKLKELDSYFDVRSGDKSPDFWDDRLLESSSEWEDVRQMARTILEQLNMQDLTVEFERFERYEMTNEGERLVMQSTKTRLVKQR